MRDAASCVLFIRLLLTPSKAEHGTGCAPQGTELPRRLRVPAHTWPGIGWGSVPKLENFLWFLQGQVILPSCGGKGGEASCPSTVFDGNCVPVLNDL